MKARQDATLALSSKLQGMGTGRLCETRRYDIHLIAPRNRLVPVSLSSFCFRKIRGCLRGWSGSGANQQVKICFRALPTLIVRKPHAATPFRTTGSLFSAKQKQLTGQSWPNKLTIGRPTLLTLSSIIQRQAPLFTDQVNVHMTARCERTSVVMTQLSYSGDASFFRIEIIEEIAV